MDRQPTGKLVRPTARDLIWFAKLQEHGPLASDYLHAFSESTHRNAKRARERLTDLFNEVTTPHGGAYLDRPLQQFATIDGRYRTLVHDLTDAGRAALADEAGEPRHRSTLTGPWLHQHMVASITASIEIATLKRSDLTYIPQSALLARNNATLAVPVECRDRHRKGGKVRNIQLTPDAMFGLAYETEDGTRYRIFFVEADRSTEPVRSGQVNRKSIVGMLQAYRALIEGGVYKSHFGLNAPAALLFVAATPGRVKSVTREAERLASAQGLPWLLMQRVPGFGPVFEPPGILSGLVDERWVRTGSHTSVRIDRP